MGFRATVVYDGLAAATRDGERVLKSHLKVAIRAGLKSAVLYWRRRLMMGHFSINALTKYGYEPRSSKYNKRKWFKYGHNVPLILTGRSKDSIQGNQQPILFRKKAGIEGAEFRIVAPKYFYQYKPGVSSDKTDELTRVTDAELKRLAKVNAKQLDKTLTRITARRKRRIALRRAG